MVRDKLAEEYAANVEVRRANAPRLVTVNKFSSTVEVVTPPGEMISCLHAGLTGEWAGPLKYVDVRQHNAIKSTLLHVETLPIESAQERKGGTWRKVIFTSRVRQVWREFGHVEPPTRNSTLKHHLPIL